MDDRTSRWLPMPFDKSQKHNYVRHARPPVRALNIQLVKLSGNAARGADQKSFWAFMKTVAAKYVDRGVRFAGNDLGTHFATRYARR
jgi:hypothetical protein